MSPRVAWTPETYERSISSRCWWWFTPYDGGKWNDLNIQRLEAHLAEICPDWDRFRAQMMEWWLCAPKSFRFLERILWAIGQERPPQNSDRVPGFLQCEDTYPSQDDAARWWTSFCAALNAWWRQPEPEPFRDFGYIKRGPPILNLLGK